MRCLCDENIPRRLVEALRRDSHDVVWIREDFPGISDADVLALAIRDSRVCLTFDKDFGELAARTPLPADSGVVPLRMPAHGSVASVEAIVTIINSRDDWSGHFSVLEPGRIRMRPLGR